MKRIACICVIVLCSISFAFAQGAKPGRTNTNSKKVVKKTVVSPFAEAGKAWIPFWQSFKKAIRNRNANELKEMMPNNFSGIAGYSPNDTCNCKGKSDGREAFFCYYNCEEDNVWVSPLSSFFDSSFRLTKISKDEDIIFREFRMGVEIETAFHFEYKKDGKWYFVKYRISGWA